MGSLTGPPLAPQKEESNRLPIIIGIAAVVIVVGSQLAAATLGRPASKPAPAAVAPAGGDAAPAVVAPAPGGRAVAPADGPIGGSAASVARIDHAIAAWTT